MAKGRALIVWGGWDGHEPELVAHHFESVLKAEGFEVEVSNDMESFTSTPNHDDLTLIVPIITMSSITNDQIIGVTRAVRENGVGMAGCHGGMCDSFRSNTEWQFMTGGQWVAHPGDNGVRYKVEIVPGQEITAGINDFEIQSEQYYLHVDPGVKVLATTRFPAAGVDGPHVENHCDMPQVWTKMFGRGRVFYNALGHDRKVFDVAEATELMRRGFNWAARTL